MTYFEPPPLPGSDRGGSAGHQEPADPYASPPQPSAYPSPPQPLPSAASPQDGWRGPMPTPSWAPPAQTVHPRGSVVLVLGILSITVMMILGPVAWVLGQRTLREMDVSGLSYANRSSVQAGMILGIIGTGMTAVAGVMLTAIVAAVIMGA